MKRVIYVAGLGRSGSTLVDMIISTNKQVFSVGECYRYHRIKKNNLECACGMPFSDCGFWSDVAKNNLSMENRYKVGDYLRFILYLINPFAKKVRLPVKSDNQELLNIAQKHAEVTPKDALVLDSSKDPVRLAELDAEPDLEVLPIVVTRDVRGTAKSFTKKIGHNGKNYYITVFKWLLINGLLRLYALKRRQPMLFVSYELLTKEPKKQIKRVEEFLELRIPENYEKLIPTMQNYHNIGGSRLARIENRRRFQKIEYSRPASGANFIQQLFAIIVAGLANWYWVYRK